MSINVGATNLYPTPEQEQARLEQAAKELGRVLQAEHYELARDKRPASQLAVDPITDLELTPWCAACQAAHAPPIHQHMTVDQYITASIAAMPKEALDAFGLSKVDAAPTIYDPKSGMKQSPGGIWVPTK